MVDTGKRNCCRKERSVMPVKPVKVGLKKIEQWNDSMEVAVCKYEEEQVEKGQIVFYGPSNFTRWSAKWGMTPLREEILGKSGKPCAVNRGFGSSCTEHHLYYYPRMVRALEPKVLVYAPGLGNGLYFGYTKEELFDLAQRVVLYAQADFPDLKVYLCGLNLYRDPDNEDIRIYDGWIRQFVEETPNCTYVDVTNYKPLQSMDLFAEDKKHYNREGYKRYGDLFREVLKEELEMY